MQRLECNCSHMNIESAMHQLMILTMLDCLPRDEVTSHRAYSSSEFQNRGYNSYTIRSFLESVKKKLALD